jgi:hypothetical protein
MLLVICWDFNQLLNAAYSEKTIVYHLLNAAASRTTVSDVNNICDVP